MESETTRQMSVQELRERAKTLEMVIEDSSERIASNPHDVMYVNGQLAKQKAWEKEKWGLNRTIKARNITCDPKCIDPQERKMAEHYGVPHDSTTCACKCHERPK